MDRSRRRFAGFLGLYVLWLAALGVLAARSSTPPERPRTPAAGPAGAVPR